MKKLLLHATLLIGLFARAQDFKNISNSSEAINQASILASKSSNSKFLNSQKFVEENLFAVRFVTPETSAKEYDKLDISSQNRCLTVLFRTTDTNYIFDSVTGSYDVIFAYWQGSISKIDIKDNQNKKYFDKTNKIVYLLSEDEDDRWKISRQLL
jgi:hypothetical protein